MKTPSQWSVAQTKEADTDAIAPDVNRQWWGQLNDPLLSQLIEKAVENNLDIKTAQSKIREARASRLQAASSHFPTVKGSFDASRTKYATGTALISEQTLYEPGFDASWEIDLFGGTRRAVEAADATLQSVEADANNTRVSLIAELAENYVSLRAYQQRLDVARANLLSQSETLQITDWRNQAGLANSSDVEQARTSREQTRASIPDLEVGIAEAANRLSVLIGEAPGAVRTALSQTASLPAIPPTVASGIPASVLTQRPDVLSAERTLAAETARIGQKLAQRYPSLNLTGSFGWEAYSLSTIGAAGTLTRSVGASLAATLFDGGKLRAAVDIQTKVQQRALLTYQSTVLSALEEVENALSSYANAKERLDARTAAAQAARNAALLARAMYEAGLTDFQKVLETERTRLSAEDSLVQAQATSVTSVIKLYKALGGGWSPVSANAQTSSGAQRS